MTKKTKQAKQEKPPKPQNPPKPQYISISGSNQGIPLHILFTIVLIFAGGVGTAISFAHLDDMRRQITRRRAAVHQLIDENNVTRNAMGTVGLEELRSLAEERLNMHAPTDAQMVSITVPPQAGVYLGADIGQEENVGIWQSAWGYIRGWLSID